jgi:hypothetical protein
MEVQYDQEPFARPRYGYIVTAGRHEEQRSRISFLPLHQGSLESEENPFSYLAGMDKRNAHRGVPNHFLRPGLGFPRILLLRNSARSGLLLGRTGLFPPDRASPWVPPDR